MVVVMKVIIIVQYLLKHSATGPLQFTSAPMAHARDLSKVNIYSIGSVVFCQQGSSRPHGEPAECCLREGWYLLCQGLMELQPLAGCDIAQV